MEATDIIGLGKKRAQNIVEEKNMIFRLIRVDQEQYQSYPDDVRTDRVCVEIDNEKITKATIR